MTLWIFIVLGAILEVVGDFFLKKQQWALGLGLYFIGSGFWALSLKETELSRAIVLFTVVNLLLAVAIGIFYFDEILTVQQMLGVLMAVGALVLI